MSRVEVEDAIARYAEQVLLHQRPDRDGTKVRVTGPFTVEAVPAPSVAPISDVPSAPIPDTAVARTGESLRQSEWRAELLKAGVRGKGGQKLQFVRVEPLAGATHLHAEAEIISGKDGGAFAGQRVAVCFGPQHAALEQRQVELAWEEARSLDPKPAILLFCAFSFDPEAAKDIDAFAERKAGGMTFLRAEMNNDLNTEDLKKKRSSNESFWLIGQPDVVVRHPKGLPGAFEVEVLGFDYFNTKTGDITSGGADRIAMWMLDPDYDGRSIFPRQVFFPMADPKKEGWARLAKTLKAEIDEQKIEAYRGTVSLPFEPGKFKRIAVRLVDDRGIESLVIRELK